VGTRREDFEEFVVVCGDRLLRTAFLLTGDPGRAEGLLQSALAKAWFAWGHLDDPPETHVRRLLLVTSRAGRRDGGGHGVLAALPARLRAVVVLRVHDGLTEDEAAELLGWSVATVRTRTERALARLGVDRAELAGDLDDETGTLAAPA